MPIEILAYEPTSLGILCLRRRELLSRPGTMVTEVTLNHEFLMSSYLTESERVLTSSGLGRVEQPAEGLKVLVGGFGLGYTAYEALKSDRVASVEVVEFLPEVIGWFNDGLIPLTDPMKAEQSKVPSRLVVTHGDIYARLTQDVAEPNVQTNDASDAKESASAEHNESKDQFDLIAIDVDHSPEDVLGEQSHGFYTEDGLRKASAHLSQSGVLAIWSYAADTPLLAKMKTVFAEVEVQDVTVFNDLINEQQTDWLFFGRRSD